MPQSGVSGPLVSVVLTVFNIRQDWTAGAIGSILDWHEDLELILVDDGSTDAELVEYLSGLPASEPRVRYVRQDNAGTGAARRTGVANARGRWVTLMDPDDHMLGAPNVQAALVSVDDADLIVAAAVGVAEDGISVRETYDIEQLGGTPSPTVLASEMMSIYLYGRESAAFLLGVPWAKFFRTSWLLSQDLNFDPRVVKRSDAEWLLRALGREPRVVAVNESAVAYRLGVGYSGALRFRPGTIAGYGVLRDSAEAVPGVPAHVQQLYRLELVKDAINSIFSNPRAPRGVRSRKAYREFLALFPISQPLLRSGALSDAAVGRKMLYLVVRMRLFMPILALLGWKTIRLGVK